MTKGKGLDAFFGSAPVKKPAAVPAVAAKPLAEVRCMFSGPPGKYPFIEGTLCDVNGPYCPPSVYKDAKVFNDCPTRKQKLKERS